MWQRNTEFNVVIRARRQRYGAYPTYALHEGRRLNRERAERRRSTTMAMPTTNVIAAD